MDHSGMERGGGSNHSGGMDHSRSAQLPTQATNVGERDAHGGHSSLSSLVRFGKPRHRASWPQPNTPRGQLGRTTSTRLAFVEAARILLHLTRPTVTASGVQAREHLIFRFVQPLAKAACGALSVECGVRLSPVTLALGILKVLWRGELRKPWMRGVLPRLHRSLCRVSRLIRWEGGRSKNRRGGRDGK